MILVLNCGSQSIKWKLFDEKLKLKKEGKRDIFNSQKYQESLKKELLKLKDYEKDIRLVGHRVVHGGEKFKEPIKINKKILKKLGDFNELAPLHNPFNLLGIKIARNIFPKISHIAVFDTEFYIDLPEKAFVYPIPERLSKKYNIRRLGFHGISHEYTAEEGARRMGKPFRKLKIITCHLGGGSSITAIKNGRAIDTSMGFTPMEGLMMMTRSGDIDPGIILYLNPMPTGRQEKISSGGRRPAKNQKLSYILNHKSGVKGICGLSNMKDALKAARKGNKKARLALDMFVYRIQKYIGAYFAILGGCDLLVFTGSIGFGSAKIRNMVTKMPILKKVEILAVNPDEELIIAKKIIKFKNV